VRVAEGGAVQHVVRGGSEFVMTFDAAKTQAILSELGRGDLTFPVEADGAALTVVIPTAVTSAYGECPQLATMRDEGRRGPVEPGDCLVVQQLPSPTATSLSTRLIWRRWRCRSRVWMPTKLSASPGSSTGPQRLSCRCRAMPPSRLTSASMA
ncbi:MAG TPA: hypothetical protein PK954_15665, partial [Anaerolineales bacterium]|nr:hypothetical protein [Anaerolineales bacterium]